MPRGIPNSRVQHTTGELANDLGLHEEHDHDEFAVIDMMEPNAEAMAMQVAAIEPVSRLGFAIDSDRKDANGGTTSLEYEAFMQEPVTIKIAGTTDKNAPWAVYVSVNGDWRWLPRNVPIRLKRKFVERLAQAQERSYSTPDDPDPAADVGKRLVSSQANAYEFSVLQDPNPKGRRWLQHMLRSGS